MDIKTTLNKQGFTIRRTHFRKLVGKDSGLYRDYSIRELNLGRFISATGGKTEVRLTNVKTGKFAIGAAFCSDDDCYNRKEGVKIALQRAIEAIEGEKPTLE